MTRDAFDHRIEQAARSLRPEVPTQVWERLRTELETPRPRWRLLPPIVSMAAAALLVLSLWWSAGAPVQAAPTLLSDRGLQEAARAEDRAAREFQALRPSADPEPLSPAREQLAMLDAAIAECQLVLARNERHRHLRDRLLELSLRRNQLLRELLPEPAG